MDAKIIVKGTIVLIAATCVACGSGSQSSAPVTDAYISSTATCPGAPDYSAGASCNNLVNDAASVASTAGSGDPPTFTGGTIKDGVYHATKAEAFGTTTGTGRRFTLVVLEGGTKFYYAGDILDAQGAVATTMVAIASASTSGNQLTQTTVCMTGSAQIPTTESYTATGTELILSATQGSVVAVTTYARAGCP